jgi:PAS domain S-box-containing protein
MTGGFFSQQMDYVYFVYGLAFMLLAAATQALSRMGGRQMPWKWLCLFGLSHGTYEWLDMLALSQGDAPGFALARLIIMATSFLFLVEFGRAGTLAVGGKGPREWVCLPLLALAGLGALAGQAGLNAATRYALGLTGGLWSAYALWQRHRSYQPASWPLRVASIAIAFYGLSAGIVVPKAGFFPASWLNYASFSAVTGFPIQLARTALGCMMAVAVWQHYRAVCRSAFLDIDTPPSFSYERVTAFGLATVILLGWVATETIGRQADRQERGHLLALTTSIANAMDAERVERLTGTPADAENLDYQGLKEDFLLIRSSVPDIRCVYLLGLRGDQAVFYVHTAAEPSRGHGPGAQPGTVYGEASPELRGIFRTGRPMTEGPLADRWGVWISALSPVVWPADRRVLAVLGIDVDASRWVTVVRQRRLPAILLAMLIAGLLLVFFVVQQESREAAVRVTLSERRYRSLVEGSPSCVQLLDAHGRYVAINPAGLAGMGYAEADILGKRFADIWPATTRPMVEDAIGRGINGEQASFEADFIRPDGRAVTWYVVLNAIRKPDGTIGHLVAVGADITERKRREEALRESEERFRLLFARVFEALLIVDERGRIVDANEAVCRLLGYSREELLLLLPRDLHPAEEAERVRAAIDRTMRSGVHYLGELVFKDKNGRTIPVEAGGVTVPIGGKTYIIVSVRDVTERKRAEEERRRSEEQLRQAQKMESIGRLAGGVAHDFNNIITGISGYTQFVLDSLKQGTPEYEDLTQVKGLAERAAGLTRQLLTFSRRQPLRPVVLDVNETIENLSKMLRRLIGEDVELEFIAAPGLGMVRADQGQIEQVLMNLAVNARDAMPHGGRLTIETANATLSQEQADSRHDVVPGDYVMLAVTDTGSGMDKATRERLFEPFFTTKPMGKGTGLGLAVVYGIVKQHGGNI